MIGILSRPVLVIGASDSGMGWGWSLTLLVYVDWTHLFLQRRHSTAFLWGRGLDCCRVGYLAHIPFVGSNLSHFLSLLIVGPPDPQKTYVPNFCHLSFRQVLLSCSMNVSKIWKTRWPFWSKEGEWQEKERQAFISHHLGVHSGCRVQNVERVPATLPLTSFYIFSHFT